MKLAKFPFKKIFAFTLLSSLFLTSCGLGGLYKVDTSFKFNPQLNEEFLNTSLEKGTAFLLNNQTADGNFHYEYNFLEKSLSEDDNEVRQTGALWGLTLIHNNQASDETREAIVQALDFFYENSVLKADGSRYLAYPDGNEYGKTGSMALINLALIDFLRTEPKGTDRDKYLQHFHEYMTFLMTLRQEDGLFYGAYDLTEDGKAYNDPSPYSDGEALLAMIKAINYIEDDLSPELLTSLDEKTITESADEMIQTHIKDALKEDPDSDQTKGFYQWGSMSFLELYLSDYSKDKYATETIELANWMIDVHLVLERTRNTAYAFEGIISAYELARLTKDQESLDKFAPVIDQGLATLTSWQIDGPIPNVYLQQQSNAQALSLENVLALGGVMNKASGEPLLRIDVTQHQMHAVILALRYAYN
jgi:hypothetical protein